MITIIEQEPSVRGTYILWIAVGRDLTLAFGRFKGGKSIAVPAGHYAYIGSAMGARGATTLARRLIRHATRSADQPPHAIRDDLLARLAAIETGDLRPRRPKSLFWNIDYLLDQRAVEIAGVIAIQCATRLEDAIARRLDDDPATAILEAGLGAHDAPGQTHLLRVYADESWWHTLPDRLAV